MFSGEKPLLTFGVVSDIHVTTRVSTALFEKSLRYFDARKADAVMVPGDLADGGNVKSLEYIEETWQRVFPRGIAADGRAVAKLFCTGNHDVEGWAYGDMKKDLDVNGLGDDVWAVKAPGGMKAVWEKVFGEDYAPIRVRTVKGFDFVSAEWSGAGELEAWMTARAARFAGPRPFFCFQHPPAKGTTPDGEEWADGGRAKKALSAFPNAVLFTGHSHRPFCDERSIWQGAFTAIATPSLSYAGLPPGHENGGGSRDGKATQAMPRIPTRLDLRGGQGYFVSVYADRIVVERVDLEEDGAQDLPAWVVPYGAHAAQPYADGPRAAAAPVPVFPVGARLMCDTRNTETRQGKWVIVMHCTLPTAVMPDGGRVFDYEIRAVTEDGSTPLVKRFLSPAYHKLAKYEPAVQRFWFDADELPKGRRYRLEVRARNCFGKAGKPVFSETWCGK